MQGDAAAVARAVGAVRDLQNMVKVALVSGPRTMKGIDPRLRRGMMMRRHERRMLGVVACLALLLVSGCQPETVASPSARSAMPAQDSVPLIRPLSLAPMAAPLVVEFNLDPPGRDASPTILVAVRVTGEDGGVALERALQIQDIGLPARVQLTQLRDMGDVETPLVRVEKFPGSAATLAPIQADGRVANAWLDDADDISLEAAGLSAPRRNYKQLSLAWGQNLSPGKYRLSVQLLDPSPQLASIPAELLIAYKRKSK